MSKKSKIYSMNLDFLKEVARTSLTKTECLRRIGYLGFSSEQAAIFTRACGKLEIDISHLSYENGQSAIRARYTENCVKGWLSGALKGYVSGWQKRIRNPIRNYLLSNAGHRCEECGWNKIHPSTGRCHLEIHHKDGDAENERPNNLIVLCPNCHSLTSNYKSMNSRGRPERRTNSSAGRAPSL